MALSGRDYVRVAVKERAVAMELQQQRRGVGLEREQEKEGKRERQRVERAGCNNPKIHTPKITTTKFLFKPYVMLSDTCRSQTLVLD